MAEAWCICTKREAEHVDSLRVEKADPRMHLVQLLGRGAFQHAGSRRYVPYSGVHLHLITYRHLVTPSIQHLLHSLVAVVPPSRAHAFAEVLISLWGRSKLRLSGGKRVRGVSVTHRLGQLRRPLQDSNHALLSPHLPLSPADTPPRHHSNNNRQLRAPVQDEAVSGRRCPALPALFEAAIPQVQRRLLRLPWPCTHRLFHAQRGRDGARHGEFAEHRATNHDAG
jgi:hypothetical protein